MGQLRSGKNLDVSSKLRLNKSNLRNRDPDDTEKDITPKNINVEGAPSFYEKDYEGFIRRK